MNESFKPNHFVPLVDFVANDGNRKKNKQQKITDMFNAKRVKQENIIFEGMKPSKEGRYYTLCALQYYSTTILYVTLTPI